MIKKKVVAIKGSTKLVDVISKHPEVIEVFFKRGLHCVGCAAAHFETLEDGAKAHGLNDKQVKELINEINLIISKGGNKNAKTNNTLRKSKK